MERTPTIQDVANLATVSITTVSHILHGKSHLYAPATAKRVWEASGKLNYHPNRLAQSLARRSARTLGVVVMRGSAIGHDTSFSKFLSGIFEYAASQDYQIKLIPWQKENLEATVCILEDASIDGALLFAPLITSPLYDWARTSRLPSITVGASPDDEPVSYVDADNMTAVYEAVRWLIAQGHRSIGWLQGDPTHLSSAQREKGYRCAMQANGIEVKESWMTSGGYRRDTGHSGALQLLQASPELTAIACGNDWSALGALQAAQELGLEVPGDISILGFDDVEMSQFARPSLATVRRPMSEIGMKAAELLIRQIESKSSAPVRAAFPCELVPRESVSAPRH